MRVVISICKHELEMAHRWMDWVIELGGTEGHSLHLIPSSGTDIKTIFEKANKAFHGQVSIQIDYEAETSDWQIKEPMRSASGPNSSFRQVAWDSYMNKKGPFFWCELDCVPLRKDWLDRLEAEYKTCGKPFMGAQVLIETVPEHMSGNAIYPTNVPEEAPLLVMRTEWTPKGQPKSFELAFDVAGARDVLPKAYWTNLIQHKFRYKGFESREEFDSVIDPNAVVFHSCKDGSIYQYLRENLSGGEKQPCKHGSEDEKDGLNSAIVQPDNSPPPAQASYGVGEGVSSAGETPVDAGFTVTKGGDAQCKTTTPDKAGQTEPETSELTGSAVPTVQPAGAATVVSRTFKPTDELESVIAQNSVIKNGLPAMSPPWENREDSEKDVKMLCDALALFCKAPIYKSRVRNALREAKIIK